MEIREKIAVVVDSCADIPKQLVEQYHIFVMPMVIMTSEGEFFDGVNITAQDVYELQKREMPKTGCPTGATIMDTFAAVKNEGYTKAVVIALSGGLSGTVNNVRMLAEDVEGLDITVFDSKSASIGIGVIGIQAAAYVAEGMEFEQLKEKIQALIRNTRVFFSIDTLEYLQKGGRIGKVTAVAGTLLKIKPVLSFDEKDGEIYTAAKVRGKNQVPGKLQELVQECQRDGRRYNIVVADGGAQKEGDALEERIKESFPDYENLYRAKIGAALSVYLGDGLLGAGIQFLE